MASAASMSSLPMPQQVVVTGLVPVQHQQQPQQQPQQQQPQQQQQQQLQQPTDGPPVKKKRKSLNVEEKLELVRRHRMGQSLHSLEKEFGVQRKQIRDWANNEEKLLNTLACAGRKGRKRASGDPEPDFDWTSVSLWLWQQQRDLPGNSGTATSTTGNVASANTPGPSNINSNMSYWNQQQGQQAEVEQKPKMPINPTPKLKKPKTNVPPSVPVPPQKSGNSSSVPCPPSNVQVDQAFLWNVFQRVDGDRSGEIDVRELQTALSNGNWTPFNDQTVRLFIAMFDRDGSGTISFEEFGALWKYVTDWQQTFLRFDSNHTGNIDQTELKNALVNFGYQLTDRFYDRLVLRFDRTGTGTLNFDDFIQLCVVLQTLTSQFRLKDKQRKGVIRVTYEDFLSMVLNSKV